MIHNDIQCVHSAQLKAQVRASAVATTAAKKANDEADVKIAQALKIMEHICAKKCAKDRGLRSHAAKAVPP